MSMHVSIVRCEAIAVAEATLFIYRRAYSDDQRPRLALEVGRRHALGRASDDELALARATAQAALDDAAREAETCPSALVHIAWAAADAAEAVSMALAENLDLATVQKAATWAHKETRRGCAR